jgi:hypothetical protein
MKAENKLAPSLWMPPKETADLPLVTGLPIHWQG